VDGGTQLIPHVLVTYRRDVRARRDYCPETGVCNEVGGLDKVGLAATFDEIPWDELGGKLDQEMRAAFLLAKAVVPGMTARGYGRIVYLGTVLAGCRARA